MWSLPSFQLPAMIQKRLIKFILKRTFGQLIESNLQLDQLDVSIGSTGILKLRDLKLNIDGINQLLPPVFPFVLTQGSIDFLELKVPWMDLETSSCKMLVDGIHLSCILKAPESTPAIEKEITDLINSVYIANDFLSKQELYSTDSLSAIPTSLADPPDPATASATPLLSSLDSPFFGVQYLAQLIDSVLLNLEVSIHQCNIKVSSPNNPDFVLKIVIPEVSLSPKPTTTNENSTNTLSPSKYLTLPSFYISFCDKLSLPITQHSEPYELPFYPLLCTQDPTIVQLTRYDTGWQVVAIRLRNLLSFVSPIHLTLSTHISLFFSLFKKKASLPTSSSVSSPLSNSSFDAMWMVDPSQISSTTSTALDTSGSKPTGRVDDSILLCKLEEPDKIGIEQTVFYSMLVESSILPTYTFSFQIFGWTWYVLSKLNPISETEIWETDSFLSSLLCIFSFEKCSLDVNNQKFEILQAQLSFPSVSKPFLEIPSLIFRKQGLYLPRLNLHYCSDEKLNLSDTTPRVWEKLFRCNSFVAAENLPENPSFFNFSNLDMFPFPTQFIIDINDIRVLYTSGPTSSMSDPIQFEISIAHISIPFSLKAPTLQFYDFQLKMNQTLLFKTSKDVPSTLSYSFKPISSSYLTSFTSLPSFRLTTGLSKLCVLSHIYCEFSTVDFYLYEAHFEFIRNLVSTRRSSSHPFHHAFHFHFRSFNCKDCFLHTEVKGESFNLCWSSFGFLLNVSKSNVYVPESSKCLETNVLALDLANGRFHAWYDQVNRSSHAHLSQCSLFLYPSVMEYLKKLCQTISRFKKVNSVDMESSYTGMPFLHYLSNTLFSPETFIPFSAYTKDLDVYLYPSFTEDCKCIHWNIEMGTLLLAVQPTLRLEVHQFVGSVYLDKYKWVEFQFSELFFIQLYLSTFPVQVYVDSPKLHLFFTPSTYQLAKRIVFFMTDYFLGNSETSTPISNPVPADNKQEEVAELLQSLLETTDPFPTTLDASSTSTEPLTLNKSSNLSISVVEDFATFEEHLDQTMVLLDTDLHLSTISEGSHSNHFMDLDIVENYFAEDTSEDCFADPTLFSPTSQENAMLRLRQANVVIYLNQEESTPIAEIYMEGHLETKRIEDLHWATRLKLIQVSLIDKCPSSTWHKLLTFEKHLYNVKIDWDWVRSEHRLVLNCQPMKLHLDQDTVQALMSFFSTMSPTSSVPSSLFFQRVEIYPINIKLDYKPKKVDFEDLQSGQFLQLLNFFHLEGAELVLQHAVFTGVHGIEELIHLLIMHWLPHIKNTQLGNMVSGVGPLRSFVNLGSGMVDLVLLPVSQYRKEGKVIKGLQRGAHSFVKTAAVETLNLGTKVSVGTYTLLRKADCFLENQPAPLQSAYAQQPKDLKEGIELAYKSISKNVSQVAKVLAMPIQTMERDKTGAMRQVLRAVPIAILKPMLGATEAMGKTLMGLRNTVDPSKKLESQDKYKPL